MSERPYKGVRMTDLYYIPPLTKEELVMVAGSTGSLPSLDAKLAAAVPEEEAVERVKDAVAPIFKDMLDTINEQHETGGDFHGEAAEEFCNHFVPLLADAAASLPPEAEESS